MAHRLSISPRHALDALALNPELAFGFHVQFLSPPPRNMPDVIAKHPNLSCFMERDYINHVLASALDQAGLQAAYVFETTKDECKKHPLRKTAPQGSIIKTLVSNDMRIMRVPFQADRRQSQQQSSSSSSSFIRRPSFSSRSRSSRVTAEGSNPLFDYWVVKTETSAYGTNELSTWHSVQLNSPILREIEVAYNFQETQRALAALGSVFPEGLRANSTCAMHVHVSPARAGLSLTTLHAKRIATLVFFLEEHLLFPLCGGRHRDLRAYRYTSLQAGATMSSPPDIEARADGAAAANLPAALLSDSRVRFLWNAREMRHVARMIARPEQDVSARETALGVKTHKHPDGRETCTLEFRHAEASLEKRFVSQWLAIVTTICKVAWLDARGYKDALEEVLDVLRGNPRPQDAWQPLLRILNGAAPDGWRIVADEAFWKDRLNRQRRH